MEKEKQNQYNSTYYHKHKEKEHVRNKKYRDENPEKIKQYRIKQKKNNIKSNWKSRGLNMELFEIIYEVYETTTTCDICSVILEGRGVNQKCMDHCHYTGDFRNIVCKKCNCSLQRQI